MTLNDQDTHSIVVENVGIGIFDVVDIYINEEDRQILFVVIHCLDRVFTGSV